MDLLSATNMYAMPRNCGDAIGGVLDNDEYPYHSVISANAAGDTPYTVLTPLFSEVERTFMARMFLMWDPTIPNGCAPGSTCTSIPIPLGHLPWQFSAVAVQNVTWVVS
jgi:hypothetical protein